MIGKAIEYEKMAKVEGELWWYRTLHGLTLGAIEKQFGSDRNIHILDMGCGTGGLLMYLKTKGYQNVQGFDISEDAVRICQGRGLDVKLGNLLDAQSLINNTGLSVIVSNDTLCYLTHQQMEQVVQTLAGKLASGGLLLMNLPALDAFGGIHDKAVGIIHRFDSSDAARLVNSSGLELLGKRYWPFSLSPLIYLIRLIQRGQMKKGHFQEESDVELPNRVVNSLLYGLVSAELRLIRSGLFGSSLFVVLRKR
jgi:SAM-dependent methyltransferase